MVSTMLFVSCIFCLQQLSIFRHNVVYSYYYSNRSGSSDYERNKKQIDKKFEAFNFHVINIDGNDFDQIDAAFKEAKSVKGRPTVIIAKTVKGKGVSFMENQAGWHGKAPNDEEFKIAMADLEKAGEALCQK